MSNFDLPRRDRSMTDAAGVRMSHDGISLTPIPEIVLDNWTLYCEAKEDSEKRDETWLTVAMILFSVFVCSVFPLLIAAMASDMGHTNIVGPLVWGTLFANLLIFIGMPTWGFRQTRDLLPKSETELYLSDLRIKGLIQAFERHAEGQADLSMGLPAIARKNIESANKQFTALAVSFQTHGPIGTVRLDEHRVRDISLVRELGEQRIAKRKAQGKLGHLAEHKELGRILKGSN